MVSNGVFRLAGSSIGPVRVGPAGAFLGEGAQAGPVLLSGRLSAGDAVGRLVTGPQTWNGGGRLDWHLNHATNRAGWDE